MKLAIMQPYFFPYIGYFQLMKAVDKFVVYDDVNFINRGWINRNRVLVNGRAHMFTVSLKDASQNVLIKGLELAVSEKWKNKFLKTLEHSYSRAPYYEKIFSLVSRIINIETKFIIKWHLKSFELIYQYLNINTVIVESSAKYENQNLQGQHRILDICIKENADHYINPLGGQELYDKALFINNGIKLNFLKSTEISYPQFNKEFIPWLSIIDVMMFNAPEEIIKMLNEHELI